MHQRASRTILASGGGDNTMSRWALARRWMLGCLPVLALFAPPIWSQFVARAEFERFHRAALSEIVRKGNLDPAVVERVRKSLQPGRMGTSGLWDKNRAAVRLTEVLKQGDLSLKHDNGLFEVRRKPIHVQPEILARTNLEFVDSLSSVIRRLSILDQLGPGLLVYDRARPASGLPDEHRGSDRSRAGRKIV